jgi:hypothetical protein
MKYQENPVIVEAYRIVSTHHKIISNELVCIELENGKVVYPSHEMLARITPQIGDYLVIQEDGYQYLNPKDVFERKYSKVEENSTNEI